LTFLEEELSKKQALNSQKQPESKPVEQKIG
jgi:hypothetical protein